jgi:hypothetical protein
MDNADKNFLLSIAGTLRMGISWPELKPYDYAAAAKRIGQVIGQDQLTPRPLRQPRADIKQR